MSCLFGRDGRWVEDQNGLPVQPESACHVRKTFSLNELSNIFHGHFIVSAQHEGHLEDRLLHGGQFKETADPLETDAVGQILRIDAQKNAVDADAAHPLVVSLHAAVHPAIVAGQGADGGLDSRAEIGVGMVNR